MKIRNKLLISVLSVVAVVLAVTNYVGYVESRAMILSRMHNAGDLIRTATEARILDAIHSTENVAKTQTVALENVGSSDIARLRSLIEGALGSEPRAMGSAVVFLPEAVADGGPVAEYCRRTEKGIDCKDIATGSDYDYQNREWFKNAVSSGKPVWSEPHYDEARTGDTMLTYAHPFMRDGKVVGVVTAQLSLDEMTKILDGIRIQKNGYPILIGGKGDFMYTRRMPGHQKDRSLYVVAREMDVPELKELADKMTKGESGYLSSVPSIGVATDEISLVVYGPVESTNWSIGVVYPQADVFRDLDTLNRHLMIIGIIGLLVIMLVVAFVSHRISEPLVRLAAWSKKVIMGDISTPVPPAKSDDEPGQLSRTFEEMMRTLWEMLEQTKDAEATFGAVLTNSSDGLVVLNSGWRILKSSPKADQLLLLPPAGPFFMHMEENFPGFPREQLENIGTSPVRFELTSKAGKKLSLVAEASCDKEGKARRIVIIVREIA